MMSETNDEEASAEASKKVDAIALAETLHTIMSESTDAEAVRIALAGLQGTQTGRDYLNANPVHY